MFGIFRESFSSFFGIVCNILIIALALSVLSTLAIVYSRLRRGGTAFNRPWLRFVRFGIDALPSLGLFGTVGSIMFALDVGEGAVQFNALRTNFAVALVTTLMANFFWLVCSGLEHVLFDEPFPDPAVSSQGLSVPAKEGVEE